MAEIELKFNLEEAIEQIKYEDRFNFDKAAEIYLRSEPPYNEPLTRLGTSFGKSKTWAMQQIKEYKKRVAAIEDLKKKHGVENENSN